MILYAFGCSFTEGQGLKPKELNWPQHLAKLWNVTVINQGERANANLQILWKILNTVPEPNSRAIVMWSNYERESGWNSDEPYPDGFHGNRKRYKAWTTLYSKREAEQRTRLWAHHAQLWFEKHGCDARHTFCLSQTEYPLKNCTVPEIDVKWNWLDLALDQEHPGKNSHRDMAEQINTQW